METLLMTVSAILLVVLNGLFVAAEFAFVKVRPTKLQLLAKSGHTRAIAALFGLKHLDAYLSVCQLGITLASLGLGWIGEPAVSALMSPLFKFFGIPEQLTQYLSIILGFGVITFAHVTFGELAPKTISIRRAESTVLILAIPMRFFYILFLPFVKLFNTAAMYTLKIAGISDLEGKEAHSTEELKLLIAASKQEGLLDDAEERFVNNIFNMDKRFARDIMLHRTQVISVTADAKVSEVIKTVKENGYTRFPVYQDSKDNPLGFIHAKDLLAEDLEKSISDYIRPALYIYDHLAIDDVLEIMQKQNQQFGLVWDEYGSWQGLITMEHIFEAIVGNIQDEFDSEEPTIVKQKNGSLLVNSLVSLDEIKFYLPLDLGAESEEHYRNLAALLLEKTGKLPEIGENFNMYGAIFTVTKIKDHHIDQVRVTLAPTEKNASQN